MTDEQITALLDEVTQSVKNRPMDAPLTATESIFAGTWPNVRAHIDAQAKELVAWVQLYDTMMDVRFEIRAERDAARAEIEKLREALGDCLSIIDIIDAYQKRVGLGEYGTECACCRGELFDDGERPLIAAARATLAQETQP